MRWLTILSVIALLAYPLAVYFGLSRLGPGVLAGVLALLFIVRMLGGSKTRLRELKYIGFVSGGAGIVLAYLGYLLKQENWFRFYPVVVNALMFFLFCSSLWQRETLIERLARLQDPELPPEGVAYTRTVTKVWCGFFVVNGAIALTTCFMDLKVWTLYNGFISYMFAGSLFVIEWIVRQRVKK